VSRNEQKRRGTGTSTPQIIRRPSIILIKRPAIISIALRQNTSLGWLRVGSSNTSGQISVMHHESTLRVQSGFADSKSLGTVDN
jgi:hypothetical protein